MEPLNTSQKGKKKKKKLEKDTINIIRTTQRNNIELTHIADNKANVLLSLNAIMMTFLIPLVITNVDTVISKHLYIPLFILALTCFSTIYIATIVLKPSQFKNFRSKMGGDFFSPFFFGNFYHMEAEEFFDYMQNSVSDSQMVKRAIAQDLFYVGKRLGFKMTWVRHAFNLFLTGLFLTLVSTAIVLFI